MNIHRFRLAALLLAASACAVPAWADSPSASAGITELSWQLIDLNPADGIAPEVVFTTERANSSVSLRATDGQYYYDSRNTPGSLALDVLNTSASGTASVEGASALAQLTTGTDYSSARATSTYISSFTLTPYTGILFSALSEVAGAAGSGSSARATASLSGRLGDWGSTEGNGGFNDSVSATASLLSYTLRGYLHSGAVAATGNFYFTAESTVTSIARDPTSPVPEPATSAMLIAGLAVLGAGAARRRARGQH